MFLFKYINTKTPFSLTISKNPIISILASHDLLISPTFERRILNRIQRSLSTNHLYRPNSFGFDQSITYSLKHYPSDEFIVTLTSENNQSTIQPFSIRNSNQFSVDLCIHPSSFWLGRLSRFLCAFSRIV